MGSRHSPLRAAATLALALSCTSPAERAQEQAYANAVVGVMTAFQTEVERTQAECNRGMMACAVAAQDGAVAARRARSELSALTPPPKLAGANQKLMDAFEHIAASYDEIAGTYWDRAGAYEAYVRATHLLETALKDGLAAGVVIGFKGDSTVWARR